MDLSLGLEIGNFALYTNVEIVVKADVRKSRPEGEEGYLGVWKSIAVVRLFLVRES